MQAQLRTTDGETDGEIDLHEVFDSEYRPDLIQIGRAHG